MDPMESGTTQKSKATRHKTLKLIIDVVSGVSLFFLSVGFIVLSHYQSNTHNSDGSLTFFIKLAMANTPLAIFGMMWLIVRYFAPLTVRYPVMLTQRFKFCFVFGSLALYLIGYLIIKNTLFKWFP